MAWMPRLCAPRITRALALALLVALSLPAYGIEVLLLWDDSVSPPFPPERPPLVSSLNSHTQALIGALEAAGISVTLSFQSQSGYNGSTPPPSDFDAVIHLNGNIDPDEFDLFLPPGSSTTIEQYVRNGGAYIGSENNDSQINGLSPSPTWLGVLTPIKVDTSGPGPAYGTHTLTPVGNGVGHPIFDGLTAPIEFVGDAIKSELRTYGTFPAESLATDAEGNVAVAIRELDEGRVVGFYHKGNYRGPNQYAETLSDPTAQQLYINAVRWADQRPPRVASIVVDGPPISNGANVAFIVTFTESVTGVDLADFSFDAGSLGVGAVTVTPISAKEYRVETAGVTGSGTLRLDLLDDGSITDESVGENSLAGGDFTAGDFVFIDAVPPAVQSVFTNPFGAGAGDTPTLSVEFEEPMKNSVTPVITVQTASNGPINLISGSWIAADRYQVTLGRALTNLDGGPVTVSVTTAQDLVGNLMTPYNDTPLTFGTIGLSADVSPRGLVFGQVGDAITFNVSLAGTVGTPQYDWKKEDNAKGLISVGTNSPTLTLSNLTFADSGTYFCVVTDDVDVTQTPDIFLNVVEALPALGGAGIVAAFASIAAGAASLIRRRKLSGNR